MKQEIIDAFKHEALISVDRYDIGDSPKFKAKYAIKLSNNTADYIIDIIKDYLPPLAEPHQYDTSELQNQAIGYNRAIRAIKEDLNNYKHQRVIK